MNKKSKAKKAGTGRKPRGMIKKSSKPMGKSYDRRTYVLDDATIKELDAIQEAIGATSASESVRYAIRKMARIMRIAGSGVEIRASIPLKGGGKRTMLLDIPPAV